MEKTVREKQLKSITGHGSEAGFVVSEEGLSQFVEAGRPKQLVDAVLEAQSNPKKLLKMGAKARLVAEQKYSREKVVNEYYKLINKML